MSKLSTPKWLPSKSKVIAESYSWHIEKFSEQKFHCYRQSHGPKGEQHEVEGIESPTFTLSVVGDDKLNLSLTRNTVKNHDGTCAWLKLSLCGNYSNRTVTHSNTIVIVWISGRRKERISELDGDDISGNYSVKKCYFSNPEFVLYNDLFDDRRGLLCDNRLSIVCEVYKFTKDVSHIGSWLFHPVKPVVVHNIEHTVTSDLQRILHSGENSDVKLIASDGREFSAHSLILSSRSIVFAAMFNHDMKEKRKKRVNIDDLSSNAVGGLVNFIYTDTVPDITSLAPELLPAAHRYEMPRLLVSCEVSMVSNLNTGNAVEYFLLADLYGASQLRRAAKHFITTHLKEVKAKGGWKTLMDRSSQLADEIVDELADLVAQLTSS